MFSPSAWFNPILLALFATLSMRKRPFMCQHRGERVLGRLQGSSPVAFLAEVQCVENPGCDQHGREQEAEREQMKITACIFNYFLHAALTLRFRKNVSTQEVFKFLCHSQSSHFSFLTPQLFRLGKLIFFKKIKYLISLSVYLKMGKTLK